MKKKLLALCLVVVLAAIAITGATLAYFTDTEEVKNTFTVGKVAIKLDEYEVEFDEDSGDYKAVTGETRTETGNSYTDIVPAQELSKDPMVTVLADSEDCYVRMKVTVDYNKLTAAFPKNLDELSDKEKEGRTAYPDYYAQENGVDVFLLQKMVDWNPATSKWEYKSFTLNKNAQDKPDGTATYEFWYKEKVEKDDEKQELEKLFTKITIPAQATNGDLAELATDDAPFTVDVKAEAIQADTFGDASAAFAALDAA